MDDRRVKGAPAFLARVDGRSSVSSSKRTCGNSGGRSRPARGATLIQQLLIAFRLRAAAYFPRQEHMPE